MATGRQNIVIHEELIYLMEDASLSTIDRYTIGSSTLD